MHTVAPGTHASEASLPAPGPSAGGHLGPPGHRGAQTQPARPAPHPTAAAEEAGSRAPSTRSPQAHWPWHGPGGLGPTTTPPADPDLPAVTLAPVLPHPLPRSFLTLSITRAIRLGP